MLRNALILSVVLMWMGATAQAGMVTGQVKSLSLSDKTAKQAGDDHFWNLPLAIKKASGVEAAVVLENERTKNLEIQVPPAQLTLRGYGVFPPLLTIRVGDKLKVNNLDDHPYSCKIENGSTPILLDGLSPNETRSVKIMAAGVLTFKCQKFPFIRASIVANESPFSAVTDHKGQFQIPKVPPGEYLAKVFAAGKLKLKKQVQVSSGSNTNLILEPQKSKQPEVSGSGMTAGPTAQASKETPEPKPVMETKPPKQTGGKKPLAQKAKPQKQAVKLPPTPVKPALAPAKNNTKTSSSSLKDKPAPKKHESQKEKPKTPIKKDNSKKDKKPASAKKPQNKKNDEGFKDVEPEIEIEVE